MSPELEAAIERAREWDRTASPEEKAAMYQAQREGWARAMAPCEHGDPDWETCPDCLTEREAKHAIIAASKEPKP